LAPLLLRCFLYPFLSSDTAAVLFSLALRVGVGVFPRSSSTVLFFPFGLVSQTSLDYFFPVLFSFMLPALFRLRHVPGFLLPVFLLISRRYLGSQILGFFNCGPPPMWFFFPFSPCPPGLGPFSAVRTFIFRFRVHSFWVHNPSLFYITFLPTISQ